MNTITRAALLVCLSSIFLTSCLKDVSKHMSSMPTAFGKTNGVVVVADDAIWNSNVRDTFEYFFEAAYPLMPQPEPLFDVRRFKPEELEIKPSKRELRTYIFIANIMDEQSPTTRLVEKDMGKENLRRYRELNEDIPVRVAKNRWASNQVIIYVLGKSPETISQTIAENYTSIASRIHEHDLEQIEAKTYIEGEHIGIGNRLQDKYGTEIRIPDGYKEAKVTEDFTWLRKDAEKVTYNLLFYKMPYTDKDQLTAENAKEIRNRLGEEYVAGGSPGSYMVINDEDLPLFDFVSEIDGNYALELRGIWEMTEDFAGGPFFSWLIHNAERNELIFIDAFVLAPQEDKRDFMQQLEYIVKNIKLNSPQ